MSGKKKKSKSERWMEKVKKKKKKKRFANGSHSNASRKMSDRKIQVKK